jgi:hypothetical protein
MIGTLHTLPAIVCVLQGGILLYCDTHITYVSTVFSLVLFCFVLFWFGLAYRSLRGKLGGKLSAQHGAWSREQAIIIEWFSFVVVSFAIYITMFILVLELGIMDDAAALMPPRRAAVHSTP